MAAKFMMRNGRKVAVIRPATLAAAQHALELAQKAVAGNDKELFDAIPMTVGEYSFRGYLSADARVVLDERGKVVEKCKAGDSFVDPEAMTKTPEEPTA